MFVCQVCGRHFVNRYTLERHKNSVSCEPPSDAETTENDEAEHDDEEENESEKSDSGNESENDSEEDEDSTNDDLYSYDDVRAIIKFYSAEHNHSKHAEE